MFDSWRIPASLRVSAGGPLTLRARPQLKSGILGVIRRGLCWAAADPSLSRQASRFERASSDGQLKRLRPRPDGRRAWLLQEDVSTSGSRFAPYAPSGLALPARPTALPCLCTTPLRSIRRIQELSCASIARACGESQMPFASCLWRAIRRLSPGIRLCPACTSCVQQLLHPQRKRVSSIDTFHRIKHDHGLTGFRYLPARFVGNIDLERKPASHQRCTQRSRPSWKWRSLCAPQR